MSFCFLQLRHALQCQFWNHIPDLTSLYLLAVLLGADPKKLTSICFNTLLTPGVTELAFGLRARWVADVGELDDEEWSDVLTSCKLVSPKRSDRLAQLYILHRLYLTPANLTRCKPTGDPSCPRCGYCNSSPFSLHLVLSGHPELLGTRDKVPK